jgi:hypothetical protein
VAGHSHSDECYIFRDSTGCCSWRSATLLAVPAAADTSALMQSDSSACHQYYLPLSAPVCGPVCAVQLCDSGLPDPDMCLIPEVG